MLKKMTNRSCVSFGAGLLAIALVATPAFAQDSCCADGAKGEGCADKGEGKEGCADMAKGKKEGACCKDGGEAAEAAGQTIEAALFQATDVVPNAYPLDVCAVSGGELGEMKDIVVKEFDGREARFCCGGCVSKFEADQEKYWAKVDEKIIEQQRDWYPLDKCVISGGELGGMGDPIELVYNNRLVRLCCGGCIKSFKADPVKHFAKVDEQVIAKYAADYPLDKCAISGESLDSMGGPQNVVVANRLVQVCCGGCIKSVLKNPAKYIAMVDEALAAKKGTSKKGKVGG